MHADPVRVDTNQEPSCLRFQTQTQFARAQARASDRVDETVGGFDAVFAIGAVGY
jgi:hypothetical protein